MIAFIQQEAAEKAEEIDVKAEEEFNIEKSRLVSQQRIRVIEYYDKKEKQLDSQRKVQRSHLANASRLSILKARDDYIQALKEEARSQLFVLTEDRSKYKIILGNLITQGLFQLMERQVTLRCRRHDYDLVQQLIPESIRRYKQELKDKDCKISIDDKNFLSDDSFVFIFDIFSKLYILLLCRAGGVELYGMGGKIKVTNTMEARLSIVFNQILPEIREKLFGANHNRRYHD